MSQTTTFFADAALFDMEGTLTDSIAAVKVSPASSGETIPSLVSSCSRSSSAESSSPSSRRGSFEAARPAFQRRFGTRLILRLAECAISVDATIEDRPAVPELAVKHTFEAWQLEAAAVDRSVRILPGVKRLIGSIPEGRYAVATSGARTYAYGCMTRVGITPPKVTITADDKRLKAGKPGPDPFLLAASELGFHAARCVVFEDSPSGIRAGVASGAIVVAVCTSHAREQIANCGAHFIVDTMEQVRVVVNGDDLMFTVTENLPVEL